VSVQTDTWKESTMRKQHENRLDRELESILAPLGVGRENATSQHRNQGEEQQANELHITCISDLGDQRLWHDLSRHLHLLKHPLKGGVLRWHEETLYSYVQSFEVEEISNHLMQSQLILLGVSVNLVGAFRNHAEAVYETLVRISQEMAPQIVLVMLRPVIWEDEHFIAPLILPKRGTITTRQHRERSYVEVAEEVYEAIKQLSL